ncbi:LemA family protein [Candidatus Gugararchaeum adminiculabundum]|nr:LemA family protein [Candidatus Gugararchaeum adminiculabundum]
MWPFILLKSSGDPAAWGLVLLGVGLFAYRSGLAHYYLKKTIEFTPTSKAVAVAPGITEVAGKARPYKQTYTAPYSGKPCLFYSTSLYKWQGSGKNRRRNLVKTWATTEPFYLQDDTGKVLLRPTIQPKGGAVDSMVQRDLFASHVMTGQNFISKALFGEKTQKDDSPIHKFIADNYPSLSNYNDKVEVEETFIADGDPIYALGTARMYNPDDQNPEIIIEDDPKRKFYCLSDGTEKDALSHVKREYQISIIGGPLAFLAGAIIMAARFRLGGEWYFGAALITVLMYLWMVQIWVLAIYNGLVILKNNSERAKANIDTLLLKRHDLIPELVEIVKSYSIHEKTLFKKLADLRSQRIADASKSLIAIAENYPQLMANEQFKLLQDELVRMESEIAGSRSYYNDSVVLYNKQIAVFPHLLAAKWAKLKPLEFYTWED